MPKINIALRTTRDVNEYSEAAAERKKAFHREGKKFLASVAADLGLQKSDYDLRSNVAGIAVAGEVTLHTDTFYLQLCESIMGRGFSVLHRSCKHRKDYTGGSNNFVAVEALEQTERYTRFLNLCRSWMAAGQTSADIRLAA